MSALKDIYSPAFYNKFSNSLTRVVPSFNKQRFITEIFNSGFDKKELKERMKHTTRVLHSFLPADFSRAVKLIMEMITTIRKEESGEGGLEFIFFPDYIETYGLNDYQDSIKALEFITQFISCEFAVRPFILKYGDKMIHQMQA